MRIKQIEVYGYGKLSNTRITLQDEMNVLFGGNEAGKTTWMEFIRHVLFGFPGKNTSERRFEPKQGGTCGGNLVVETSRYGVLKIERILTGTRATGELKITDLQGKVYPSETLEELLNGVDESTFKNIYHFGLDGLSNLHNQKGDEVSRYLFSTSVFGQASLEELMSSSDKKMGELLKQRGNAKINSNLTELESVHKAIGRKRQDEAVYGDEILREKHLTLEITKLKEERKNLERGRTQLKHVQGMSSLINEENLLERQVEALRDVMDFPIEAHGAVQELNLEYKELENRHDELQRVREQLEFKATGKCSNFYMKKQASNLLESLARFEDATRKLEHTTSLQVELKKRIQELRGSLGDPYTDEEIEALPGTFEGKSELQEAVDTYKNLRARLKQLELDVVQAYEELGQSRQSYESLKEKSLDEVELKRLLNMKAYYEEIRDLETERTRLLEQLALNTKRDSKVEKKPWILYGSLFGGVGAVASFVTATYLFIPIFLLIPIILIYLLKDQGESKDSYLLNMERELKRIEEQLGTLSHHVPPYSQVEIERRLDSHEETKLQLKSEFIWMDKKKMEWEGKNRVKKGVEKEWEEVCGLLQMKLKFFHITADVNPSHIVGLLELCYQLKELLNSLKAAEHQAATFREERDRLLIKWPDFFGNNYGTPLHIEAARMKVEDAVQALQKEQAEHEPLLERYRELLIELKSFTSRLKNVRGQKEAILAKYGYEDERNFYRDAQNGRLLQEILLKQQEAKLRIEQMREQYQLPASWLSFDYPVDLLIKENEEKLNELEEELEKNEAIVNEIRLKLNHTLKILEGEDIEQKFLKLQEETKGLISEWLVLSTMKNQLYGIMNVYKKEKLPKMLQVAEALFKDLTLGEYEKIHLLEDEDVFVVHNKYGTLFSIQELSKGTQEQLYVALRFALAISQDPEGELPIILDDPFVNFDLERFRQVVKSLTDISVKRQILFFTCHQYVQKEVSNLEVCHL